MGDKIKENDKEKEKAKIVHNERANDFIVKGKLLEGIQEFNDALNSNSAENEWEEKEFIYKHCFDTNGVIYAIGTDFNPENTFKNPIESNNDKIYVTSNGKPQNGSLLEITSRTPTNMVLKPSKSEKSEKSEALYFTIEFNDLSICPTHYTLRQSKSFQKVESKYVIRNWSFLAQNSDVSDEWILIKKHDLSDDSLHEIGGSATWNINDCQQYYDKFKIKYNSNGSMNLHCSGFEIYGHVLKQINNDNNSFYKNDNNNMILENRMNLFNKRGDIEN
eukprot:373095_1